MSMITLLAAVLLIPTISVVFPDFKEALTADVLVGIDLGTTYSIVATCTRKNVTVQLIDGRETMPSVVYFNSSVVGADAWKSSAAIPPAAVKVGVPARDLKEHHPRNVVYAAKRLMGLDFDSPTAELEREALQYDVQRDEEGLAVPAVDGRQISPEEVGSWLLRRMKKAAQDGGSFLRRVMGFKFKSVTVSVPVSFDYDQKAATIRAANKAGFSFVRVIEEPIAAAIAYGLNEYEGERLVVVFDFGGGTLDVALLRLDPEQGTFLVMDRAGDPHLGGEDFDTALAQHFNAKIQALSGATNETMSKLFPCILDSSERAKRDLSDADVAPLRLDLEQAEFQEAIEEAELKGLREAVKGHQGFTLSRSDLAEICQPLLERAMRPLREALSQMNLGPEDIDDIVMVGGSSRLEAVREMVSGFFAGKKLNTEINPDTAIAIGAARSFGC